MQKQQVLQLLRDQFGEIRQRFGVRRLALFGSTARDEAKTGSDVDVLVELMARRIPPVISA